ncbi:unnamed protein product [Sphagnum jensenii]
MDAIKADAKTWEVDDEFPCTHRCPKQYLLDVTLTFTKLHQRYKAKIEASNDGARIFKCDDLLVDKRDHLLMEKETHLDAAIGQCRMMSNFVKGFVRHHVPNQPVSPTISPDHYDDEHCDDDGGDNDMTLSTVALQI